MATAKFPASLASASDFYRERAVLELEVAAIQQALGTNLRNVFTGGGSGTPGGSDKQIQFNDGGAFGGDATLLWDKALKGLGVGNSATPGALDLINQTEQGVGPTVFNAANTFTDTNTSPYTSAISLSFNPSGDSAHTGIAQSVVAIIPSGNTHDISGIEGLVGTAAHFGSGHVNEILGLYGGAYNQGPGSADTLMAAFVEWGNLDVAGSVTDAYGLRLSYDGNSGTLTNNYGLFIPDLTDATNNWAIKTGLGIVQFGLLNDDAAFDTNMRGWWGIKGSANIGAVNSDNQGHSGLIVHMQGDNYTQGISVFSMNVSGVDDGTGADALNLDAAVNSSTNSLRSAFCVDASSSNFGTGSILETIEFYAGGSSAGDASGPVTHSSGLHVAQHTYPGTVNARGVWIEDQNPNAINTSTICAGLLIENQTAGATNTWSIKTGSGKVDFGDVFTTHANAAPADGSLSAGEIAFWFDKTNGAAKLMLKAKQADGTVKTGSVNVAT